jgi:glycosyltransferase involved in cell wall biosynthesis
VETTIGTPNKPATRRLAIFVSFTGRGGVERVIYNLLEGLSAYDLQVDLLLVVGKKGWLPEIPWPNIRLINLKVKHTMSAVPGLIRYLRRARPDVLMVAKDRPARAAVIAHWLARVKTRLVAQLHMNVLGFLEGKSAWQRWGRCAPMRWLFPRFDLIIGVSEGVVEDTMKITGLPRERMVALPNPVITSELSKLGDEPVNHPWLNDPSLPVVVSVGRLSPEKDLPMLLRAFDRVRRQRECRLIIVGEGPGRGELERLIKELKLQECVSLAGFTENPFAYMKRASLLAFSSIAEGSGNVLIEAMALGTPVVSTDCPYGPRETLAGGKYGALVPVGDDESLARAILATLITPLPSFTLQEAVARYTVENSTRCYLEALGFSLAPRISQGAARQV